MVIKPVVWGSLVVNMGTVKNSAEGFKAKAAQFPVAAYSLALFGLAFWLTASFDNTFSPALNGGLLMILVAFVAAFGGSGFPVHVKVGREVHSFMFIEMAFVGSVVALPSRVAVVVVVLGTTVARISIQRLPVIKVIFNAAITAIEMSVLVWTTHLLAANAKVTETKMWLVLLLGTAAASIFSAVLVSGAIVLSGGKLSPPMMIRNVGLGLAGSLAMASITIIGVVLTVVNAVSVVFTVVFAVGCLFAYRHHVVLRERFNAVLRLERFTSALAPDRSIDTIVTKLLQHAAELMNSEDAALTLATTSGRVVLTRALSESGTLTAEHCPVPGDPVWELAHSEGKASLLTKAAVVHQVRMIGQLEHMKANDLIVVPLRLDADNIGILVGRNRHNNIVRTTTSDLDLITTMADHASVILERSRLLEKLDLEVSVRQYQATHDSLTGLHNRAAFNDAADTYLNSEAARISQTVIMLVDLNHFKKINDTMGHHAGDDVLVQIASRLVGSLPGGSHVARLGGDEFAVLVPGMANEAHAIEVAGSLRAAIQEPVHVGDVSFGLDAAIGLSFAPLHGTERHTLLKCADIAMYAAKERRSTPICVFDPSQQKWTEREVALLEDLRHAIDGEQLEIAYQPKTSLQDGKVYGVEALCRWTHPTLGMIRPDEFIGIAEQAGLIDTLTEFMIRGSLKQCRSWLDDGLEIGMAVNIPAQSLSDPSLPSRVAAHARAANVPHRLLTLEVTESALMEDARTSRAVMTELRNLGFRVSIDDFGTGYSSLAYLHTLPVDELKIDRAFVQRIGHDKTSAQIVHVIVELARTFGLQTVAEGIESDEIHDALRDLGVDLGQGFLMAKPATADQLASYLRSGYVSKTAALSATASASALPTVDSELAQLDSSPDWLTLDFASYGVPVNRGQLVEAN
jgi:diguanylate cyclase (GGDEF)-like protein